MSEMDSCGYCCGAWNGLDRWFRQPCICARVCKAPECQRRGDAMKGTSPQVTEADLDRALAAYDTERLRARRLEEALWHIAKRPMEKDVADDANESRRLAFAALGAR